MAPARASPAAAAPPMRGPRPRESKSISESWRPETVICQHFLARSAHDLIDESLAGLRISSGDQRDPVIIDMIRCLRDFYLLNLIARHGGIGDVNQARIRLAGGDLAQDVRDG